jgi:hypothetical protein
VGEAVAVGLAVGEALAPGDGDAVTAGAVCVGTGTDVGVEEQAIRNTSISNKQPVTTFSDLLFITLASFRKYDACAQYYVGIRLLCQ